MIGVLSSSDEMAIAAELFELFKTPWEPAVPGRKYRAVLSTIEEVGDLDTDLVLLFGSRQHSADTAAGVTLRSVDSPTALTWEQWTIPLYAGVGVFAGNVDASVTHCSGQPADCCYRLGRRQVRRIGYDLLAEVRYLLTQGQTAGNAPTPALELHIDLLRHHLLAAGVSFVEIPARPHGYDFVCCLTHDIDFFGVRRHKFDRTLAGFIFRASVGSLFEVFRGRRNWSEVIRNWKTVLSLPFVFSGLKADFWHPFNDYSRVEGDGQSTFFLVPFKGRPGVSPKGRVNRVRAVPYQVSEIQDDIRSIADRGSEVALHGIDAWRDADSGREELRTLTSVTAQSNAGIRMHWLYFDAGSPEKLQAAGFDYDSTWGYNEAVGYKAGTAQVFQFPATRLLELPLTIMDSALYYRSRMGLTPTEAMKRCRSIVADICRFGGALVINWHDRSLAPERLWERSYRELLAEVRQHRVWFATASEAVEWFRWRRSIRFVEKPASDGFAVAATTSLRSGLPGAVVRISRPGTAQRSVEEYGLHGESELPLAV